MANVAKDFVVSTADFLFYHNGKLACSGTTNLSASLTASMENKDVNGGKGNKLIFSYKYGRKIEVALETANWDLSYLAAQTGSEIFVGLSDVYKQGECVVLTAGVGTLATTPVENTKVTVELPSGLFVEVTPTAATIDLTSYGLTTESVKATYKYSTEVKSITIDAESNPLVGTLILNAEKFNNSVGKIADLQIEIPSYQLDGAFELSMTSDGVASTKMNGVALAVDGSSCTDGSVYAHVKEIPSVATEYPVVEIAATPATASIAVGGTQNISVVGIRGGLYSNVAIANSECTFTSGTPATATVSVDGVVTGVAEGTSVITVSYGGKTDTVSITVA